MRKTLEDIIIDLLMCGADRGALVRPAQKTKIGEWDDAICVLMCSDIATAILGKALLPITKELDTEPVTMPDGEIHAGVPFGAMLALKAPLKELFSYVDASPRHWLFFTFPFGKVIVTGILFAGPVCARVAKIATRLGAPCSLDPQKPAPGWEIERREKG